jgi:hypothetical protein
MALEVQHKVEYVCVDIWHEEARLGCSQNSPANRNISDYSFSSLSIGSAALLIYTHYRGKSVDGVNRSRADILHRHVLHCARFSSF